MWSTGLGKLRASARLLNSPCDFYSTLGSNWPAVYLYNSRTRAEVFLVGTNHVSLKSAEFVRNVINDVKPHIVAVELCEKRAKYLLSSSFQIKKLGWYDLFTMEGGFRERIIAYFLHNMYAKYACMGFNPAHELRVAIEHGKAIGADVSYIDQDMNVTLKRVAEDLNFKQALKYYLEARKALQLEDAPKEQWFNAAAELEEALEHCDSLGVAQALVHERNEHMVRNLREMQGSIVSVVGAGHVRGMQELWQKAEYGCMRKH